MAKWYKDSGFQSDIVLSTRVRLARNLRSVPFPGKMSDSQAQSVIDTVENALSTVNMGFKRTDILATSPTEREKLVEERLISPNLARRRMPAAVFVSEAESLSVMVNEEDHIRMQAIFAGFECQKAYELVSGLDSYKLPYKCRYRHKNIRYDASARHMQGKACRQSLFGNG